MRIYSEKSLRDFQPWSGAVRMYDRLYNAGLLDAFEAFLESEYPEGIDETELNDMLWFDQDYVCAVCGLRSESEIIGELSDARAELQDLRDEYADSLEDADDPAELYDSEYRDEIEELEKRISELESELDEI